MLLVSSRQKPIHGDVNVSAKFNTARRKGSDFTLIKLSGALEGYRPAAPRRSRTRRPDFASHRKNRPAHRKLRRAACPRSRSRAGGVMEYWSIGALRQVRNCTRVAAWRC